MKLIKDKFKYPVSSKLIQKVISQLADMRKIAVKTRMPSRFNQIGVDIINTICLIKFKNQKLI